MKKMQLLSFLLLLLLSACSGEPLELSEEVYASANTETVNEERKEVVNKLTPTPVSTPAPVTMTQAEYLNSETLPYIYDWITQLDGVWDTHWNEPWIQYTDVYSLVTISEHMSPGIRAHSDLAEKVKRIPTDYLSNDSKAQIQLAVEQFAMCLVFRGFAMNTITEELSNYPYSDINEAMRQSGVFIDASNEHLMNGFKIIKSLEAQFGIDFQPN